MTGHLAFTLAACTALTVMEWAPEQYQTRMDPTAVIQFRLVMDAPEGGHRAYEFESDTIYLHPDPVIADEDFEVVRPVIRGGEFALVFRMHPESGARFREFTAGSLGEQLALLVDSRVYLVATLRSEVGGELVIGLDLPESDRDSLIETVQARWP